MTDKHDVCVEIMSQHHHLEELLQDAVLLAEMGVELKERCHSADKCLTHLRSLFHQASRAVGSLQSTAKLSLQHAKKMLLVGGSAPAALKSDFDRLNALIDRHLGDFDDVGEAMVETELSSIADKIKGLEARQRKSDNSLPPSSSSKSVVDEKYPENWSRDSSIDLNNVVNLPPVPEDVFTSFSSNKPKRSSSLSSLKSMRKVKLFLQRAENSDEDEGSSDIEDHELMQKGDSDDGSPTKKLGNITEEAQDNYLP